MPRMQSDPDRYTTYSVKLSGERRDRFEAFIDDQDLSKSAALRKGIDSMLSDAEDTDEGRKPPAEDDLATAYKALLRLSNGGGWVRRNRAERHLSQRVPDESKDTVFGDLLQPLANRGYIRVASDAQGRNSAVFVHG